MLVEKQKDLTGQVVTILLLSGQEIMGNLVSKTDNEIVISKPRMPIQDKQGMMGLSQIMATADVGAQVTFERDKILCVGPTGDQFAQAYQAATSSVITPAKPSIIV